MSQDRLRAFRTAYEFSQEQVRACIDRYPNFFPMYTTGGKWRHGGELWTDWCGGFLAGMMWLFYAQTRAPFWRGAAEHYSRLLEHRKDDRNVHDLGFIFLNTYARWYELTGQESRMDIVAAAGVTLSGRFQPRGGYLASFLGPQSLFIDIMMNVPLLFVAADWLERKGDAATARQLRDIGSQHCRTTQRYLVRPNGSAAHECIFDGATGSFVRESTQQGLRPDSAWSRGLAWSLYGFAQVARATREREFLDVACRCADYFVSHLPPGGVPYWDFDLPSGPERLWDSSAAAIAASGLLDIVAVMRTTFADPIPDSAAMNRQHVYEAAALRMLDVLCSDEFLAIHTPGWEGILRHGVYHYHKKLGVDESVMWGDHFFVETLSRVLATSETIARHVAPNTRPR